MVKHKGPHEKAIHTRNVSSYFSHNTTGQPKVGDMLRKFRGSNQCDIRLVNRHLPIEEDKGEVTAAVMKV